MSLPAPNARAGPRVFLSVRRRTLPLNPEAVMSVRPWALGAVLALVSPLPLAAQAPPVAPLDSTLLAGFRWRNIGPANMGGRVSSVVGIPSPSKTFFVAAAGGGIWKTTNGGQTWQLVKFISDKAGFIDIAMDPTNPEVLFASSWERVRGPYFLKSGGPGSALWKTTDGGKTWTEGKGGGFPETMKGRIGLAIAPGDAKVVYALVEADTAPNPKADKAKAAQKRPSGLYRSGDGGATWTKMNDNDVRPFYYSQVRVDPKDPNRVYWSSTPVNYSNDGGKTVGNATQRIHVDHHAMWIDANDASHFIVGDDGGVSQTWDKGGNFDFLNVITLAQLYVVSYDMAFPYRVCGGLQDNGSWCGPSRHRQGAVTNADWITIGGGDGFYTAQDPTDPTIVRSEERRVGKEGRSRW